MNANVTAFTGTKRLVLIVDDEEVNRLMLGNILGEDYDVMYAEDGQEAWELIQKNSERISIVLLDLMMPRMSGFDVIHQMKSGPLTSMIPIIVLTSERSAEVESLRMGAADFIPKPYDMPEIILARVDRIIQFAEGRQIISAVERDELTNLYTKTFFLKYCEMLKGFHPDVQMDSISFNIDNFRMIDEIYGRDFGDSVLQGYARAIQTYAVTHSGIAGRGEADTFYLFVPHSEEGYGALADEVGSGSNPSVELSSIHLRIGIFREGEENCTIAQSFDRAILAGDTIRNNFQVKYAIYTWEMREKSIFQERLIHDVNQAVEQEQFVVYFQPKYDIQGDRYALKGAEALVRWNHPEFGFLTPDKYISLFEENGLIQILDHYVWRKAADQVKRWKDELGFSVPVSVNVSRVDLFHPELSELFCSIVREKGIGVEDLHIEVTESAYTNEPDQMIEAVRKLRDQGFLIEMDDFGTGYSALNMLCSIPLDVLKLDMSFVRHMTENDTNEMMVEIIMDMAKVLGVSVTAEGVETDEQLNKLKALGCLLVQGYYFSKPVPAADFAELIRKELKEAGNE